MKIILTICSKEKDHSIEDLPAYRRYISTRIMKVKAVAKDKGHPFFILSGKYGLVEENETIPYYDHPLTDNAVDEILTIVNQQNKSLSITSIEFYAKPKQGSWVPYYDVIERFTHEQNINLEIISSIKNKTL